MDTLIRQYDILMKVTGLSQEDIEWTGVKDNDGAYNHANKKLIKAEDADLIFSTYQMSSEGLDIPSLNTIILTTSRKKVEQSVGRILRKQSGYDVQPLIVDIVDNIKQFKNQGSIRKRYYKKITKIENINIYKNEDEKFIKQN